MKVGFVGITAHWIQVVKSGEWCLKANMIVLHGLSGDHGGKNLGHYIAGLCDCVGLIGHEKSKVSHDCLIINKINSLSPSTTALWCNA